MAKSFLKFSGLFQIIKCSYETKTVNNNYMARLFYCLHISKSKLILNKDEVLNSIIVEKVNANLIEQDNITLNIDEFIPFLKSLLRNKNIIKNTIETIELLTNKRELETHYKFEETEIIFFECSITTLFGFSGKNSIYISKSKIENIIDKMEDSLDFEFKNLYIYLEFIKLVQHEITHVVLRYILNDINVSTPNLVDELKSNHDLKYDIIPEAGRLAEKKIFENRIDYEKSSEKKDVNYEYIKEFIKDFLEEKEVCFNFSISKVIVENKEPLTLAIDEEEDQDIC